MKIYLNYFEFEIDKFGKELTKEERIQNLNAIWRYEEDYFLMICDDLRYTSYSCFTDFESEVHSYVIEKAPWLFDEFNIDSYLSDWWEEIEDSFEKDLEQLIDIIGEDYE